MTDEIDYIADSIRDGECLLFIGPDLAVAPGQSLTIQQLAADRLRQRLNREISGSLSHVAQLAAMHEDARWVQREVIREFDKYREITTPLHEKLADLPFLHVLSTSFDRFLLNAFARKGIECRTDWFNFDSSTPEKVIGFQQEPAGPQRPESTDVFYYQLFGSAEDHNSMVITENDLIDFLLAVGKDHLPSDIANLISHPGKTRLFLGFGLYQWHFRALLRILDCHPTRGGNASRTKSYSFERLAAVAADPSAGQHTIEQARVFYDFPGHKIVLHDMCAEDFVDALHQTFLRNPRRPVEDVLPKPEFGPVPPYVFLSYSRDESAEMERVKNFLLGNGIEVWFDQENLPGGSEWSDEISQRISIVDYLIFVQPVSPKVEAYWKIELDAALERAKRFKPRQFVIPVLVEGGTLTRELEHLQALRFPTQSEKLLTTIRQDWSLRNHKADSYTPGLKRLRERGLA